VQDRLKQLQDIFNCIDDDKKQVIEPLLSDVVYMEEQLAILKELPHIRYDKNNPQRQETTPAFKQWKDMQQQYLNAIKVLMTALYRVESDAADELMKKLSEFE
jgi:hypothetical protein